MQKTVQMWGDPGRCYLFFVMGLGFGYGFLRDLAMNREFRVSLPYAREGVYAVGYSKQSAPGGGGVKKRFHRFPYFPVVLVDFFLFCYNEILKQNELATENE